MNNSSILTTKPSADYELLDSGEGEKLERFGTVVLSRPDPQALWKKRLSPADWKKADGSFGTDVQNREKGERGDWNLKKTVPERWGISFADLKFYIKPTAFKHVGIFPEQAPNWNWMREQIKKGEGEIEILNLFAYTGGATIACAQAGAKVVHVDGSKVAIGWARDNAELSGLKDKPIRWILDDVRAFVKREIKRGRKYHGIIMDPPAFGHGAENEVWKIEDDFMDLIESCTEILADKPLFFLVNGYSAGYSAIAYKNNLLSLKDKFGGDIEVGELALEEAKGSMSEGRLLPCGIFARWSGK
ncbi:MAG: class I SAM-dependent methyltransferase [Candidatus Pacebacteria bacterium]|nr:class I SAM-dependent methyltransferase [Candidatus Paceibacterota bacterium]